ncbi:hypothetical protein Y844_14280 [Listeria monocytogenes]|nr:hypothetical protein [Listeria monocytogenes]
MFIVFSFATAIYVTSIDFLMDLRYNFLKVISQILKARTAMRAFLMSKIIVPKIINHKWILNHVYHFLSANNQQLQT